MLIGVSTVQPFAFAGDTNPHYQPACPRGHGIRCFASVLVGPDGNPDAKKNAKNSGWTAKDLQSAYGISADTSGGTGRTVAIVDAFDNPNAESDLAKYRSSYGLPACTTANGCFRKVNQDGKNSPLPKADKGWAGEISLDLDMVSAVCPNCQILLVEANDATTTNMLTAEQTAFGEFPEVVTNSWGTSEWQGQTTDDAQLHPTSPKTLVLASAGDNGYGAQWPAAIPGVVSVGGTVLSRSTSAPRGWTETAWNGTGSGCSSYEQQPTWQSGLISACTKRAMNDIAAVASGLAVFDSYKAPGWLTVGGTSASSPIVAAMATLAGGYLNNPEQLYTIAHGNSGAFNDITTGSNGKCGAAGSSTWALCNAQTGYDGPTGLGTPTGLATFRPAGRVLVFGNGDYGNSEPVDWTAQTLTATGYFVDKSAALPADLSSYRAVFYISTDPLSADDEAALARFTGSGGGVYLTGERPCCEALNSSDQDLLARVLTPAAGTGVTVGGLGDAWYNRGPLPINPVVVGALADIPNTLSEVTVDAPGGMAGVPAANVLAATAIPEGTPIAAAWDRADVTGNGRLVVFMDINWLEPSDGDTTTAGPLLTNLATFLTGVAPAAPHATAPATSDLHAAGQVTSPSKVRH
jgi:hypothetical protein